MIHRGPTEIPNIGTFAIAGDPDGAGFLLFKGNSSAPPYDPTGLEHVGWRELNAGDGQKAFAFYQGLFGWTKTGEMPMGPSNVYQLFATRSGQEGAVFTKDAETPHPFWRYYFNVEAIEAAIERVKAAGGKVTQRSARGSRRTLDRACARSAERGLRVGRAEALTKGASASCRPFPKTKSLFSPSAGRNQMKIYWIEAQAPRRVLALVKHLGVDADLDRGQYDGRRPDSARICRA